MRALSTSLFRAERIRTTLAKAKALRPFAEKLITKARRGGLHNRRLVSAHVQDKEVLKRLFEVIGPRYEARPGGYTRIYKLGQRPGDAAEMALIELVQPQAAAETKGEGEKAKKKAASKEKKAEPKKKKAAAKK
jgi:large subunit ribosomal protein L17